MDLHKTKIDDVFGHFELSSFIQLYIIKQSGNPRGYCLTEKTTS